MTNDIAVIEFLRGYSEALTYGRDDDDVEELLACEEEIRTDRVGSNTVIDDCNTPLMTAIGSWDNE